MGVTGSSSTSTMSATLPELCARVRKVAGRTPIAVGFGVNTREHFLSVGNMADGVVIGSRIVSIIKESPVSEIAESIRRYCSEVSKPRQSDENGPSHEINLHESLELAKVNLIAHPTAKILSASEDNISEHYLDGRENVSNGSSSHQVLSCILRV